jgi:peptidyl-prolyl cis-trans isomerase D
MLGWIRERNAKWILWGVLAILIVPFVFWGVQDYPSLSGQNDVAVVDGHGVSPAALEHAFDLSYARFSQQFGASFTPTAAVLNMLRRETLETLIERKVLEITARRMGIVVPRAEVAAAVRRVPAFRDGGHFSLRAYRAVLSEHGIAPATFEAAVRHGLRLEALRNGIEAGTVLAPKLLAWRYRRLREKRRFRYVIVPLRGMLARVRPTEQAVLREYNQHPALFQAPETLTIAYVRLSARALATRVHPTRKDLLVLYAEHEKRYTTPPRWNLSEILIRPRKNTPAARARARARLESLHKEILKGASFAALARRYSTDRASAAHGGLLGWVGPKELPPATVRALRGLAKGGVTSVLSTPFGWALFRVNDVVPPRLKPFAAVRARLEKRYTRRAERRLYHRLEERMANLAFEHPHHLAPIVQSLGLKKIELSGLSRSTGRGIGALAAVRAAAFSTPVLDKGFDSAPVRVGKHAVVVLRVIGRVPRHELPLAAVRSRIVAILRAREARARVLARARAIAASLRSGRPLPSPWRWTTTGFVSERVPPPGVPPTVLVAAFHDPLSRPHHTSVAIVPLNDGSAAVLEVLARRFPSFRSLSPAARKAYEASVLRRQGSLELSLFVDELRARAHIRINEKLLRANGSGS